MLLIKKKRFRKLGGNASFLSYLNLIVFKFARGDKIRKDIPVKCFESLIYRRKRKYRKLSEESAFAKAIFS